MTDDLLQKAFDLKEKINKTSSLIELAMQEDFFVINSRFRKQPQFDSVGVTEAIDQKVKDIVISDLNEQLCGLKKEFEQLE